MLHPKKSLLALLGFPRTCPMALLGPKGGSAADPMCLVCHMLHIERPSRPLAPLLQQPINDALCCFVRLCPGRVELLRIHLHPNCFACEFHRLNTHKIAPCHKVPTKHGISSAASEVPRLLFGRLQVIVAIFCILQLKATTAMPRLHRTPLVLLF